MSREVADLIEHSLLLALAQAEAYPRPSDRPSGILAADLQAITNAPESEREVRGRLHATLIDTVAIFLAHAIDHSRAVANDMRRDPVPIWSPLTLTAKRGTPGRKWVVAGLCAPTAVLLAGLIALAASVGWLVDNTHYIAAGGLFVSIVLVAGANAHRREERPRVRDFGHVVKSPRRYHYTLIAVGMLGVAGVLIVLWVTNVISLFWVEILAALLFVVFWAAQTLELGSEARVVGN